MTRSITSSSAPVPAGDPWPPTWPPRGSRCLLIEAGYDYRDLNYDVPAFHGQSTEDPEMRWDFFVRHYADQAQQEKDSKYVKDFDGKPVDGICIPAARPSAAARRTTP
jgi:hypothetical protein